MAPPPEQLTERLGLLRDLIIEASLEILDRDGLGLTVDAISYAGVFDHLEREHGIRISGGSVQGRIWDRHEDYRSEVLAVAAAHSSIYEGSHRMQAAIIRILEMLDGQELDHRDRVRAFCRIAGVMLLRGYIDSESFGRFQAIKAVARTTSDVDAASQLRAMVAESADGNQPQRLRAFGFLFRALGLRPRRDLELTEEQAVGTYMTLVQMLVTGAHLDHHAGYTVMGSKVETDLPVEEGWPWTYFGFGFLAGMEFLFEEDVDADATTPDLGTAIGDMGELVPEDERPTLAELITDRPRRSREELRSLVVAAGVELLLRDGVGLRADSVTYASVFEHVKRTRGVTIHRSSVHKHIWDSQDEFRADVLAEAAQYHADESLISSRQVMAAQPPARNDDGSVNLRQTILDSTLAIVSAQMLVSAQSVGFRRWQSIKASMLTEGESDHSSALRQAVHDRYEELVSAFMDNYRPILPLVGLRVDPDLRMSDEQALHVFSAVGVTFTSGADYNITAGATLASSTIPIPRADGSGRSDDWPIQAIASLAILDLLFTPTDPVDRPPGTTARPADGGPGTDR